MKSKTIALLLDNNFIYVNGIVRLTYEQSNLPKQHFRFNTHLIPGLIVEQVSYDMESETLKVRVIDYSPSDDYEVCQEELKYSISRIEFEKMDWNKFSPLISSYTLSKMRGIFLNASNAYPYVSAADTNELQTQGVNWNTNYLNNKAPNLSFQKNRTPVVEQIQTSVKVKFEEATFRDGYLTFNAKVKDFNALREFSVENEKLRAEFENIKPWFVKRIGKTFIVTINLKVVDGLIEDATAFSEDISAINAEMIESINTQRVLKLVKTVRFNNDDKSVFNHDEIFGILNEGEVGNVFNSSADNILEILIINGLAKNHRQLEYLSRDKHSLDEKLRFTLKPHFGFLFKVETPSKQYFIWELLNSHATYVWEKDVSDTTFYQFVEGEISFIKANGREEYRRHYKDLLSNDFKFYVVEHEGADLTDDERFQAWKNKLEGSILNFSS